MCVHYVVHSQWPSETMSILQSARPSRLPMCESSLTNWIDTRPEDFILGRKLMLCTIEVKPRASSIYDILATYCMDMEKVQADHPPPIDVFASHDSIYLRGSAPSLLPKALPFLFSTTFSKPCFSLSHPDNWAELLFPAACEVARLRSCCDFLTTKQDWEYLLLSTMWRCRAFPGNGA